MKSNNQRLLCLVVIMAMTSFVARAQETVEVPIRKNIIKVDITSYWLYRNAVVFSYERVTKNKPNQTWAITAGVQQLPSLTGTLVDSITINRDYKARGLKLGGEYRFYLKKENKYNAPHGVYIGPYASFHNYSNKRSIQVDNNGTLEYAELDADLNILNIGVQLGYQFVINNRWTLDLVFVGPSVSNYVFKSKLEGNYTFEPGSVTDAVLEDLVTRYPGLGELINEGKFDSSGKVNYWGYGYRYQFQIGYHFGRKKK